MREQEEDFLGYQVFVGDSRMEIQVCYTDKVFNSSNWTPDPMLSTTPMLYTQMVIQLALSCIIYLLLKPLNQSRLVAEIIAGIMIGPSFLAGYRPFVDKFFPFISDYVLEHTTDLGIVYYMFQLGLQMNLTPMLKLARKTTMITIIGMIVPLAIGFGSYFLMIPPLKEGDAVLPKLKSAFVWAIALTATNLPDVTRVLAELKLMRTDIGRIAIASSFVNDITTWFFLMILTSISRPEHIIRMCISTPLLILFSAYLARPTLSWLVSRLAKGQEDYKEYHVQLILCGVLVSAFITDALGLGSLVGAFLFGFSIPSGQLATLISGRIEKVATWVMVPLYCTVTGIKTRLSVMVPQGRSVKHVVLFMALSWFAKILSTFLVSRKPITRTPREVFTLGVLMNSKGLLAVIVLNLGRELYLVDIEASTVMLVTVLLMMMSVPPIVKYTYKPHKQLISHKARTIQSLGPESPFRILTCIHLNREVRGITSLLYMSNPTTQSRICTICVHPVELTEHASAAMLIVHDTCRAKGRDGTDTEASSDQIIEAMEEFGRKNKALISVQCLTAISRLTTMHKDICSIAEDKQAALIIVPFHEEGSSKDDPEGIDSHSIRNMNQQVLSNAPCTVGLLVDRGLDNPSLGVSCLVMFYIGGADDREALSYTWRMVCRPNVHLTVVRLVQGAGAVVPTPLDDPDNSEEIMSMLDEYERQKELDEVFVDEFKRNTMNNQAVSLSEEVVNNGEETLEVIRNVMENNAFHLCIVGKGDRPISPLEDGLSELVEFQELGAIGDAIVTSQFSTSPSVLVIKHYAIPQQKRREQFL